eukprot:4299939-Amphidinium_carterae.1
MAKPVLGAEEDPLAQFVHESCRVGNSVRLAKDGLWHLPWFQLETKNCTTATAPQKLPRTK